MSSSGGDVRSGSDGCAPRASSPGCAPSPTRSAGDVPDPDARVRRARARRRHRSSHPKSSAGPDTATAATHGPRSVSIATFTREVADQEDGSAWLLSVNIDGVTLRRTLTIATLTPIQAAYISRPPTSRCRCSRASPGCTMPASAPFGQTADGHVGLPRSAESNGPRTSWREPKRVPTALPARRLSRAKLHQPHHRWWPALLATLVALVVLTAARLRPRGPNPLLGRAFVRPSA
ncbi:MAG: hypothetical protein QOE71_678 [Pseudonocardiales bacterium]|jgi:hypothetical protein|nr:hypothetical protein [Pseudonocardiales bacterium]